MNSNLKIKRLNAKDLESVKIFLSGCSSKFYYIKSNIYAGGLEYNGRPYQADYFGAYAYDKLIAILSHNWIGSVQVYSYYNEAIPMIAKKWHANLKENPRKVDCFLGPNDQVKILLDSLSLDEASLKDGARNEKLFKLVKENLVTPKKGIEKELSVILGKHDHIELLIEWRKKFNQEVQGEVMNEESLKKTREEINRRIEENNFYILKRNDHFLGFCGVSGFLNNEKIVGPVWIVNEERNKDYAKALTFLALENEVAKGLKCAYLFTLNPVAESVYKSIGFEYVCDWRVDILNNKNELLKTQ